MLERSQLSRESEARSGRLGIQSEPLVPDGGSGSEPQTRLDLTTARMRTILLALTALRHCRDEFYGTPVKP